MISAAEFIYGGGTRDGINRAKAWAGRATAAFVVVGYLTSLARMALQNPQAGISIGTAAAPGCGFVDAKTITERKDGYEITLNRISITSGQCPPGTKPGAPTFP